MNPKALRILVTLLHNWTRCSFLSRLCRHFTHTALARMYLQVSPQPSSPVLDLVDREKGIKSGWRAGVLARIAARLHLCW